jgi:hypothetical protein
MKKCKSCGKNHEYVKQLIEGYICPVSNIPVYFEYKEVRL